MNSIDKMRELMSARLGMTERPPFNELGSIDGVIAQSQELRQEGGHRQQERMILQKRRSFNQALHNSYQAAEVSPIGWTGQRYRALINPNATKPDYDDKIISIGYECGFKPGTVFEWHRKQLYGPVDVSYWLIYLQDLTELAYFRGDVRKCNYYANWRNSKGELVSTWFALRGPTETQLDSTTNSNIAVDSPNHSLHILMPKNEETMSYFKRYSKFYIRGTDADTAEICWRVVATDTLSMPGILEITAIEYYSNVHEDDVDQGLVKELVIEPIEPEVASDISGPAYVKPFQAVTYSCVNGGEWRVLENVPVSMNAVGNTLELTWDKGYSGQFTLECGSASKVIKVTSLF